MTEKLIEVRNLAITFNACGQPHTAVRGISFDVFGSEIIGITGESGSGKSATVLALMKLNGVSENVKLEGEILYSMKKGGMVNLLSADNAILQKVRGGMVSMIFQEPMTALNPLMTCGCQVVEMLMLHRQMTRQEARAETMTLFQKVNLDDSIRFFNAYPHELSGGQRQRILICIAICCRPQLLIADEPSTALDPVNQKQLIELILRIRGEFGLSLIMVSHDLTLLSQITDRILVMQNGNIVEQGATKEILGNPSHSYTKGLVYCNNPMHNRCSKLPTISDFSRKNFDTTGCVQSTSDAKADIKSYIEKRKLLLADRREILLVDKLSVKYNPRVSWLRAPSQMVYALNEVSLNVMEGETVGIIGPSGAGKSTIGRAIMGACPSTTGKIFFQGTVLQRKSLHQQRQPGKLIQMIYQDPFSSLNPSMTIGSALMEVLQEHDLYTIESDRRNRVLFLLENVGLNRTSFGKFPNQFSGGQRQRIAIARALAAEPRMLICDECVSSLDADVRAQILNLLVDLREKFNLSILFISHDLAAVSYICDRIFVLQEGRVAESGRTEEILANPQSEYGKNLIRTIAEVQHF